MQPSCTRPRRPRTEKQQRDPEMHQTKKGNQWFFGMKAHVGVDSKTKIIHTAVATPAHVADSRVLPDLLHGEEPGYGVIRLIVDKLRLSRSAHPGLRTTPTVATAIRRD